MNHPTDATEPALAPATPWQPLLEGKEARRAELALDGLAAGLEREEVLSVLTPNLSRGLAGLALFYGYLAQARPGDGWEDLSLDLLGRAVEGLREGVLKAGFFTGFPGVAWTVDHLQARLFGGDEDFNQSIDAALLDHLEHGPRPAAFDLISGHVGVGVYALGRIQRLSGGANPGEGTVYRGGFNAVPWKKGRVRFCDVLQNRFGFFRTTRRRSGGWLSTRARPRCSTAIRR